MAYELSWSCDRWRHVTPKVLESGGSTVGYPSDSLASCFLVIAVNNFYNYWNQSTVATTCRVSAWASWYYKSTTRRIMIGTALLAAAQYQPVQIVYNVVDRWRWRVVFVNRQLFDTQRVVLVTCRARRLSRDQSNGHVSVVLRTATARCQQQSKTHVTNTETFVSYITRLPGYK